MSQTVGTQSDSGASQDRAHVSRQRALPLWAAIALSLALIGPTLAMSGNGQFLAGSVGKGIPLVFVIGLVAVGLVGCGFVRLTRHLNHAGSGCGLVGGPRGARAGFFAGWAMLRAQVGQAITDAAAGVVTDEGGAAYAGW